MTNPNKPFLGRVKAGSSLQSTMDGFQNFPARVGDFTDNIASYGMYYPNIITRQPRFLEWMFRGSWVIGRAVDARPKDMTTSGVTFSGLDPKENALMQRELKRLQVWSAVRENEQWGQLYGGSVGIMMIDGQDPSTPLNLDTIKQGQFKGILVMDRWCLNYLVGQVVTELGPYLGKPLYYVPGPSAPAMVGAKVHYTRVIRAEGVKLPVIQRQIEQGWGMSCVERIYDTLKGFDSATVGATQLVYKAYLRTIKIEGLRTILAGPKAAQKGLNNMLDGIRKFQSSEGLTVIDAADDMQFNTYAFSGLNDVLTQFGQQLCGALEYPMTRLFGTSPGGLNSTGEGDMDNYYDGIMGDQETKLRDPLTVVFNLTYRSKFGKSPPEDFDFKFNPLAKMSDKEKAEIAKSTTESVDLALNGGIIGRKTAMQELKQSSQITGIFSNIEDTDIDAADNEPPAIGEVDHPGAVDGEDNNDSSGDEPLPEARKDDA